MRFRLFDANRDYVPDLKSNGLHLVGVKGVPKVKQGAVENRDTLIVYSLI